MVWGRRYLRYHATDPWDLPELQPTWLRLTSLEGRFRRPLLAYLLLRGDASEMQSEIHKVDHD